MDYYQHNFVSNSELKQISDLEAGTEKPNNLDEIFARGRLNHEVLLEPHKAEITYENMLRNCFGEEDKIKQVQKDYRIATEMRDTVFDDEMCQRFFAMPDFRREWEWYRLRNPYGVKGIRCKTDGYSKKASVILEFKGLNVATYREFESSFSRFCYDQASAWYYEATLLDNYLVVAVSKKHTRRLFKLMVERGDKHHTIGDAKVRKAIKIWQQWGLK